LAIFSERDVMANRNGAGIARSTARRSASNHPPVSPKWTINRCLHLDTKLRIEFAYPTQKCFRREVLQFITNRIRRRMHCSLDELGVLP
jgi:hypothetical protein